jgi:GNAT superfamily N-acetyltransferase
VRHADASSLQDTSRELPCLAAGCTVISTACGLYVAEVTVVCRRQLLGGLKMGCKRLFLHSPESKQYLEMMPDCVLDFYVHESCQRAGIGRTLLEVSLFTCTCDQSAGSMPARSFWPAHTPACVYDAHADSAAL